MILPFPNISKDGSRTPISSANSEHKCKLASICWCAPTFKELMSHYDFYKYLLDGQILGGITLV